MKTAVVLASLLLLAGCGAASTVTWSKVGATQAQGNKDVEECAQRAGLATREQGGMVETGALFGRGDKEAAYDRCMTEKGYRKN
ncbi:MAG: hypothetical protein AABZ64_05080 [Nitrospinota bacterium]